MRMCVLDVYTQMPLYTYIHEKPIKRETWTVLQHALAQKRVGENRCVWYRFCFL